MTVDARCLIATDLGRLLDGSGLSEDHAQETGLVTYRGTLIFDGLHTPTRGQVIQLAYARPQYGASGLLTRFYPRLHTISSSADPFANRTTVEVGCALTLQAEKKTDVPYKVIDNPPSWWTALSTDRQAVVPPTIQAQEVIEHCLSALGITLASGSLTSPDVFLREEIDLSGGYVSVLSDLLRSALLVGHMTPSGELFVRSVEMAPATGPVLTRSELLSLQSISDRAGSEEVVVQYDAVEISSADDNIDINSDDQKLRDWELERTIGPPTIYTIEALGARFAIGVATDVELPPESRFQIDVEVTQVSENRSTYQTFTYADIDGKQQSQDVVVRRVATTRSSVKGKLYFAMLDAIFWAGNTPVPAFIFPPSGAIPYDTDEITEYTYETTVDGPRLKTELTREFHSAPKFATALPIESWTPEGTIATIPDESTEVTRVLVENEVDETAGLTKRKTTRWKASGKTQTGSQASRLAFEGVTTVGEFLGAIDSAKPLVMEGTEVTISFGRQSGLQTRPSAQSRQRDALTGAFIDDNSLISSGAASASYGQREPQVVKASYAFGGVVLNTLSTAYYRLPFAPDDFVTAANGVSTGIVDLNLVRGNARSRALEYGRIQNAIAFGHANGVEVTTAPWELPSEPFAPVYVDVSGLSTAFRVHGRNWEMRGGAMVVTADLALVGTVGVLPASTPIAWMPLTSSLGALNTVGAASGSGEILPANTITLPGGFDPDTPGAVWASLPTNGTDTLGPSRTPTNIAPPFVQTINILGISRSVIVATELLYSVVPITEDILAVSRSRGIGAEVTPVALMGLTAPVPTVQASDGAFVFSPSSAIALVAPAPAIEGSMPLVGVDAPTMPFFISVVEPPLIYGSVGTDGTIDAAEAVAFNLFAPAPSVVGS